MFCNSNDQGCTRNTCGRCNQNQGCRRSCGCNFNNSWMNSCNCGCNNEGNGFTCCNGCLRANPIVAPKRVCIMNQTQMVEQPVICPVECRRVNNVVFYPRYYPNYFHTTCTQNSQNY